MIRVALSGLAGRKLRAFPDGHRDRPRRRDGERHVRAHRRDRQRVQEHLQRVLRGNGRGRQRQVARHQLQRRHVADAVVAESVLAQVRTLPDVEAAAGEHRRSDGRQDPSTRRARRSRPSGAPSLRVRGRPLRAALQPAAPDRRAAGRSAGRGRDRRGDRRRAALRGRRPSASPPRAGRGRSSSSGSRSTANVDSLGSAPPSRCSRSRPRRSSSTGRASSTAISVAAKPGSLAGQRSRARFGNALPAQVTVRTARPRRRGPEARLVHEVHPLLPARVRRRSRSSSARSSSSTRSRSRSRSASASSRPCGRSAPRGGRCSAR